MSRLVPTLRGFLRKKRIVKWLVWVAFIRLQEQLLKFFIVERPMF
jgi:hypothetical protein